MKNQEEKIEFEISKEVFYNPNMQFCRSFCSVAVGAIEEPINLLDAFCASGIRGIRYAKENKNIKKSIFLDASTDAIKVLKKNLKKNKIKNTQVICDSVSKYMTNEMTESNFIEIDPFGTPVPYLKDTMRFLTFKDRSYLSVTATDTAVLCGPEGRACLKNYHSKSLNNEFTHENGLRILLKRIIEAASEHNLGIMPLFSMSDRHYMKLLLKLEKDAKLSDENMKNLGYTSFCNSCGWRKSGKRVINSCENCSNETDYAGQLWLGELHDKKFLEKMLKINDKRKYEHKEEIEKTIKLMIAEIGLPQNYYNVHLLCKRFNLNIPKTQELLEKIRKAGFKAEKTHFNEIGIKTDAEYKKLKEILKRR